MTSAILLHCIEDTAGFQRCSDPTSAPQFRFVCTPLIFQRSYSALVASACAQVVARAKGRQTRPSARVVRAGGHRVVFIKRRS